MTIHPVFAKLRSMRCLSYIVVLSIAGLALHGCGPNKVEEPPVWENVKIGDLAAKSPEERPQAKFLSTARYDVYVMDLPADNVEKLDNLWQVLSSKPIRMNSYGAFTDNNFRVRFGRIEMIKEIERLLLEAGSQEAGRTSMVVTDNEPSDLPVASMPRPSSISYVAMDLSWKKVDVAPGMLAPASAQRGGPRRARRAKDHRLSRPYAGSQQHDPRTQRQDPRFRILLLLSRVRRPDGPRRSCGLGARCL